MFFTPFVVNAYEVKMDWQKNWGGTDADWFSEVLQTKDGEFVVAGDSTSTDIEGIASKGSYDVIIVKISVSNELNLEEEITNGTATVEQQGSLVIVKAIPNEDYKVDRIIVKDTNGDVIEVTKLEDGTYAFELSDDVSVEVLFKKRISKSKDRSKQYCWNYVYHDTYVCKCILCNKEF